jgi:purine-cytosine permease-like protein
MIALPRAHLVYPLFEHTTLLLILVHIGQNDLTLLRFARTANVGWTSAGGMYIGHYFAWIVAGCMYAVQLQEDPTNTSVAPGPIAQLVGGSFGLVVIIIAGWSTANPVIYSSGLALQHIFPRMHAWLSTIIVGLLATAVACFPAITNRIIEFLAFAGIILSPMGVMVFTDYFVFPRLGLCRELSYQHRLNEEVCQMTNWPAVVTWALAMSISLPLALLTPVSVYFAPAITLPLSFALYIGLTKVFVKKGWIEYKEETEKEKHTVSEVNSIVN